MCLYTEVDPGIGTAVCPIEKVSREHAYIMIVAALEAYAEVYSPFFTFHSITMDQARDPQRHEQTIKEIEVFAQQEAGKIDLDRLDFLANLKPLRDRGEKPISRNVGSNRVMFVIVLKT